jgi:hypothetical protein
VNDTDLTDIEDDSTWWGEYTIASGARLAFRAGGASVEIEHRDKEWRVLRQSREEVARDARTGLTVFPESEERFVCSTTDKLTLTPALADRSVVGRPVTAFRILPGVTTTMYVSSPVWARVEVGAPGTMLCEFPLNRPSDTWFGPSTREGELCYSMRTSARLELSDIPARVDRAVTPLHIRNATDEPLHFERFSLPVPNLTLFESTRGQLWTQSIEIVKSRNESESELTLGSTDPVAAGHIRTLSGPREHRERRGLLKAWSLLFN